MMMFARLTVAIGCLVVTATLNAGVMIGFEASEGYVLGPLSDSDTAQIQAGWSGGAQTYFTNDSTDLEQVVNTEAHSGSNSWHAARFYGSPGQGTPFSPSLGLPIGTGPGTTFTAELWFKAGHATGDGSRQSIYLGSYAGNDRTGFNVNLVNDASGNGLHLHTFEWDGSSFPNTVFSSNLDRSAWHKLSISATFHATDPTLDSYTYTVNDVDTFTGGSWPNPWRVSNSFTPVWGDTLKFADGNGDNGTDLGFYYDDISFSSAPVPEPSSLALLGLGSLGLIGCGWKRKRKAKLAA